MHKKRTIYNSLPIVAAAYGEKFGVEVVLGSSSDTASTDGQTIVIPNVPDDYPMDVVWGYLTHEAAHIRFTDFNVERRPDLKGHLTNIIEDCRIERAIIGVYPGTAFTLHETARYMLKAGYYEPVRDEHHPAFILSAYCLYWLQTVGVGQTALQERLDGAKAVLERVFPQSVVTRLNALLHKCVDAKSTEHAASLADDIIKMLEEEKDREEQQNPKSQCEQSPEHKDKGSDDSQSPNGREQSSNGNDENSQEQRDGNSGNPEEVQGGQEQRDGNNPEEVQGGQEQRDGNSGNPEEVQGGQEQRDGNNPEEVQGGQEQRDGNSGNSSHPNNSQLLQQVLSAGNSDLPKNAQDALSQELNRVAQQKGDDRYQAVRSAMDIHDHDHEAGQRLYRDVKSTTSKIRQQLYGLVQASQRTAHRNQRSGKRVDTRQLHRVVIGDTRVFQRPKNKKRPNTAVHILVDMSSSMVMFNKNGKPMVDIAREASLAIALALESIPGVNPAVTFFCKDSYEPVYSVVKHGQKVQNQTGKFVFKPRGTTPMAEGIWYSAFELTKTREERKMMIVVTDGKPNNALACHKVIELCKASDIEMIGVGIETTVVNQLFDTNIVIEDAADLQKTLFKLMERSLTAAA